MTLIAKRNHQGFTIVELLISIVVISILASITVVAFNGIQQRAESSKLAAALSTYEKAFKLYKAQNGYYPNASRGMTSECLGLASDYPAAGTFLANECGFDNWSDAYNATLVTALSPYISNLPSINVKPVTMSSGDTTRGVYMEASDTHYYFEYGMPNNAQCPYGVDAWASEQTLCTVYKLY